MRILPNSVMLPEGKRAERVDRVNAQQGNVRPESNFNEILNNQITAGQPLQFSKHANMRLSARAIALSHDQIRRVEDGVSRASEKGIKDSLVFVDNVALVVNVKSKTVVTAMGKENENIFTNIDGAVIV